MNPPEPTIEISIVMPCLNEAATVADCVREAGAALASAGVTGEVVVADNGSTDGSRELAAAAGARVVPVAERGYGAALRGGILAAHGRYVLMGDCDCSYDFSHLPRFLERLRAGEDLVMGNRFRGGIQPGAMPWKNRYLGNPVLSLIGRLFFRTPIGDFHCGLRAFSKAAFQRMNLQTMGMEFASEMIIRAATLGMRISEVPTTLRPDKRGRAPHLRPWRDGWRHLRFMLLFSTRWLFLYPGLALLIGGLSTCALLASGPFAIGRVQFDVHTMLFGALAAMLGFQAIAFSVLGKLIAVRAGLRPPEAAFEVWLGRFSLEAGLLVGLALTCAGAGLWISAVGIWQQHQFGPLHVAQTMRLAIFGALALSLGCQMILNSFLLGVIRLDTRSAPPA